MIKNLGRITKENSILLLCDVQKLFKDLIYGMESVTHVSKMMAQTAEILKIPMICTRQNVKAFGETLEEIQELYPKQQFHLFEKSKFSMLTPEVVQTLSLYPDRKTIVLFGIEGHVCVQQTCLDLLESGYNVHLLTDGVSSQRPIDRSTALQRMMSAGAFLTTAESFIFEVLKDAKSPEFKEILPVLKQKRNNVLPGL